MPTSQIYWVMPDQLTRVGSGLHHAEVEVGRKWVRIRPLNKKRFSKIHLTKWQETPHVLDTGQTLSEIANALRLYTKKGSPNV